MSNFTTEVRFICESLNGTSSLGFLSIDSVLDVAAPKIFDFDFPIYDENYRLILEKNILRHYYTREIGEETYGLWKLRLNARLNEIMPYYNQLYESALIEYNPLYNVDYNDVSNESRDSVSTQDYVKNAKEEFDRNVKESTSDNFSEEGKSEDNYSEIGNKNSNRNFNEKKDDKRTHTTTAYDETFSGTDTERENPLKYTKTKSDSGISNENNNEESNVKNVGETHNNDSDARVNRNSDTPQLGLNMDYNEDSPSDNMYLTDMQKTTGSKNSNGSSKSEEDRKSGSSKENSYKNDTTESLTYSEEATKTFEHGKKLTKRDNFTDDNVVETDVTEGDSENNSSKGNKTNLNSNIGNRSGNTENDTKSNNVYDENNSSTRNAKDSASYAKRVFGRNWGITPAKMIKEFRETFLNIDLMIIDELSDLFFGLWE